MFSRTPRDSELGTAFFFLHIIFQLSWIAAFTTNLFRFHFSTMLISTEVSEGLFHDVYNLYIHYYVHSLSTVVLASLV